MKKKDINSGQYLWTSILLFKVHILQWRNFISLDTCNAICDLIFKRALYLQRINTCTFIHHTRYKYKTSLNYAIHVYLTLTQSYIQVGDSATCIASDANTLKIKIPNHFDMSPFAIWFWIYIFFQDTIGKTNQCNAHII